MTRGTASDFPATNASLLLPPPMVRLRQLAWSALAGGVTAGVLLFVLQSAWITPLIREAERYEHGVPETGAPDIHSPAPAEKRGESATPPPVAPPAEPTGNSILFTTLLADIAVGLGYALLLCAGILLAGRKVDALRGLAWGACGYAALVLAPSLGLPPEPPGASTGALASLGGRQLWWLLMVGSTIMGLWTFAFAKWVSKAGGIVWLLAPHAALRPLLLPPDGGGGTVPAELAAGFLVAVLAVNAAFWLLLGSLCGWVWGRLEPPG